MDFTFFPHLFGPAFGRTIFCRIFIFEPPDFLADFLAGFFLVIFVGKNAQKNTPGKSPGNPPPQKSVHNKNPPTHLCRLAGALDRSLTTEACDQHQQAQCLARAGFQLWDLGGADASPMMQYKPQVAIEMSRSEFLIAAACSLTPLVFLGHFKVSDDVRLRAASRQYQGGPGSVRFGYGFHVERFERTVPTVPVPISVPGKTVPTFPVSGSGSVPAPSCNIAYSGKFEILFFSWTRFPWLNVSSREAKSLCSILGPIYGRPKNLQHLSAIFVRSRLVGRGDATKQFLPKRS